MKDVERTVIAYRAIKPRARIEFDRDRGDFVLRSAGDAAARYRNDDEAGAVAEEIGSQGPGDGRVIGSNRNTTMDRNFIAAFALAAVALPGAALDAAAAPGAAAQFGKTYKLYCAANGTNRIYVGNRTAPAIKAGTQLQIMLWTYKNGNTSRP